MIQLHGVIKTGEKIQATISQKAAISGTISAKAALTGSIAANRSITGTLSATKRLTGQLTIPKVIGMDPYQGEYEVTPSEEEQVLNTGGKYLSKSVVVAPIPSNYGRITWDGRTLTVS